MLPSRSISSSRLKLGFVATELAILVVLLLGLASGSVLVQQSQNPEKKAQQRLDVSACLVCNKKNCVSSNKSPCIDDLNECTYSSDCRPTPTRPYMPPDAPDETPHKLPEATPTRAKDPGHCNGCWVAQSSFCVRIDETNSDYICCAAIDGGRNYPHFEKGNTCGSTPTPGPPKDEPACRGVNGCWVPQTSVCVRLHEVNAGYKCCNAYEGRLVNVPHFEKIIKDNSDPCVVISTPTPAVPTPKPCFQENATRCTYDNRSAAICARFKDVDESLGWLEHECTGNTVCGKYINNPKNEWFDCITHTPTPREAQQQLAPLEAPANKKGNNNILNLFRRFLNFLF